MQDIKGIVKKFSLQSGLIILLLTCFFIALGNQLLSEFTLTAMIVCAVFSVCVEAAYIMIWHKVASKSPDMLTTFYSAVSGFRLLLALATMGIYYVATDNDMMTFLIVFAVYYFTLLTHNTFFFARLTNSDKK